ncbi:hypothetical protein M9H77_36134 [Catharanthus roseus]|uniref:Uncharacterized protein n=1 Tax=Catharanthus roseus TaxID=4058 RepID=A0ACB9ZSR4_CATRO|nr:hypothetical protein M9H77_36134 [Catharanthus roseus]
MDESRRKRKSFWDVEEENRNNSWTQKEQYSTDDNWHLSPSQADNSLKPKDQSRWSSLETHRVAEKIENVYNDGRDASQIKEHCRDYSHYKSMSPGFDGWVQRKHNRSPEDTLGQTHRYMERGRSRSRDNARSRGHSRSWSRDRGRDRGSGWRRSRSRSRSRTQKVTRSKSRSRSPFHDRQRESYGWNDRRSGSGVSSQICRDFPTGKCRRGSECRFLHPENISRMDRDCPEKGLAQRSASGIEHGHGMRYSKAEGAGAQSWGRVSDVTYGEEEPLGNRNRGRIPCKDFIRGNCKWGASCRFLHHTSSGDNDDQGGRNTSFDRDREHQANESGKSMCKYFLAGSCHRVNCRFSHDGRPTASNRESRPHDNDDEGHGLVKGGRWSAPSWDEMGKVSMGATRLSENLSANRTNADSIAVDVKDSRWDYESRIWGDSQPKEKASANVDYPLHKWDEDGGDAGFIRSTGTENFNDGREHLTSQDLESTNIDTISAFAHEQNSGQETSNHHFPMIAKHPEVSIKSDFQQHQNVVNDNVAKAFSFGGLKGGKDSTNTINTVIVSGQTLDQNGAGNLFKPSLVANDNMLPYQASAQNIDLNGPSQLLHTTLNLQSQIQSNHNEAAKKPVMEEDKGPQSFPNPAPTGQDAQIAYLAASLAQKVVNEQLQPNPHTALNSQTSAQLMSSLQSLVPSLNMTYVHPSSRPSDHSNLLHDATEPGNSSVPHDSLPHPFEQENQLPLEEFSPFSIGDTEAKKALEDGSSKVQYNESLKSEQQDVTAAPKIEDIHRNETAECKGKQENIQRKGVNDPGKVDDADVGNKDEKEMRLFKNALIEFVKVTLKPTWKEGRMSREVHKTVVKKVVDKVTSSITADNVPKTQDRIEQYLSHSKSKITKLVQAYVERNLKSNS